MAQEIIAIDVSRDVARVAIIEATMRRASLLGVRQIDLEPSWTQNEIWQHIRNQLPTNVESVVVALDSRAASTRLLQFPFGDLRKAESAVEFELEGQVPYNIEDVATAHTVTGKSANHVEMLAAITPKAGLGQLLSLLSGASIEPRAVVLSAACLAEFLPTEGEQVVAVAALGARECHLAVGNKTLRFARTVRAGGDDIDRAVVKHFNVSVEEARKYKETDGILKMPAADAPNNEKLIFTAMCEGLAPLVTNLLATFKALPPEAVPRRLLLTGGLSRLPGIAEYLQQRLGLTVELLDLRGTLSFLAGAPASVGPEFAVSLAMAVAQFRHGRDIPLNFRRGAFAYHGDIQLYRGQLTRIAVGTVVVLTLAIMTSVVRYTILRSEESEIDKGFCEATQKIVGKEICDPTAAIATLKQTGGADGVNIPSYSAGQIFEMLSKVIAVDIDAQFDELDLRVEAGAGQADRVTGKGEAASFEATEKLVAFIKRDVCVQEAEVSNLRKTQQGGRVAFSLAVKVACPAGVRPATQIQAVQALAAPAPTPQANPAPAVTP